MNFDISTIAILVTILLALFGVVFGYGMLTNRVNTHSKDIDKLETSYRSIDSKLDSICNKVASIETELKHRGKDANNQ